MKWLAQLARWFFSAEVPAQRLAALRILVFGFGTVYLVARAAHLTNYSRLAKRDFAPVGAAAWLNDPLPSWVLLGCLVLTVVLGAAATAGVKFRWTGPAYGLGLLFVTSYRNSWGMIFHTENLLVLHTLILAVSHAADAWCWRGQVPTSPDIVSARKEQGAYAWPLHALSLVTVLSYVVAGVAKLQIAGTAWVSGEELRSQIAFDALRKIELGSAHSPIGAWLVKHESYFTGLAWLTLAFELGAPLALLGGRIALVWCAVVWGFHAGVMVLMFIVFPYPLLGVALASFFHAERWIALARAGARRLLRAQERA